jgi:hypothetical protein
VARPLWTKEHCSQVLQASADQEGPEADRLDLRRFKELATVYRSASEIEHLLLSDGRRSIRIDIVRGSLEAGPARLRYRLTGFAAVEAPLLVLRRLVALRRNGRFSPPLHPREARAARWVLVLRAHDALAAGATQRDIAARMLSGEAEDPRWRLASPTVRSRAQRLVRAARETAGEGYRRFLA